MSDKRIKFLKAFLLFMIGSMILMKILNLFTSVDIFAEDVEMPGWIAFILGVYWVWIPIHVYANNFAKKIYKIFRKNNVNNSSYKSILNRESSINTKLTDLNTIESRRNRVSLNNNLVDEKIENHTSIIDDRSVSSARTSNNDYIKIMLLNRFTKPGPIYMSNSQYPYWFVEQLGINDIGQRYQNYLREGYLEQASDKDILMKLLKKDLEDICITLNLPKTGNKIDLVNRITSVNNYSDTTKYYTGSSKEYILSNTGKTWLEYNRDILSLSTNYRINVDDYMDIRNSFISNGVKPDFNQIALIFYQKEVQLSFEKQKFWEISSMLREMSAMYLMNDDLMKQLDSLILAFVMDLSCLGPYGRVDNPSLIVHHIGNYKQLSNYSESEILVSFEKMTQQLKLPYQKYPFSVMSKMIRDYHQYGEIGFDKYERFINKAPFLTEFDEYWKDPRILYNY